MSKRSAVRHLALATSLLASASCGDLFETGGSSEKGYFQIEPGAHVAVGGWLKYTVRDYELGTNAAGIGFQLLSASDDAAVSIRSVTPAADLIVDGLADGSSRIEFRARADGKQMEDAFTIGAETVTRVSFSACRSGGLYVRGTDGHVFYTFNRGGSARVKGLGLYPIAVQPQDAVTLRPDVSTPDYWVFAIPTTAPAQVTLVSTLPDDVAEYTMNVIDASAVDGLQSPGDNSGYPSSSTTFDVVPTAAGQPVCVRRRVVTSTTPGVCKVKSGSSDVTSLELVDESVSLHFLAAGTCIVTVSLPELGITLTLPSWTVSKPSSGGGGDDDWD